MSEENKVEDLFVEPEVVLEEEKIEEVVDPVEEVLEVPEVVEDTIVLDKPEKTGKGMGIVPGGAIGSTVVKNKPKADKPKPAAKVEDKIAVHSTRNVTWEGVGKVYNGYNIVTKAQADKWLTRDHIRLATPEEVAKEFGL